MLRVGRRRQIWCETRMVFIVLAWLFRSSPARRRSFCKCFPLCGTYTTFLKCFTKTCVDSQDPREELLKYDEETKKDKEFLGSAYEASQPKGGGMYHRTLEEEEEDFKEEQRKLLDA